MYVISSITYYDIKEDKDMITIVLVGGNGYIGREITRQWLKRDLEAQLYITSRNDRQEIKDSRIHHIQVDVNDAYAFDKALPEKIDYIVNLTYGSADAMKTIREAAEKHGAQAIGNFGVDKAKVSDAFQEFAGMKEHELQILQEGNVRIANYDITIAYGADRSDDLQKAIQAGAFNDFPPVHVEVAARQLIDRLTRNWLL